MLTNILPKPRTVISHKNRKRTEEAILKGKAFNAQEKTLKVYFGKKKNYKYRYLKALTYIQRMGRMEMCLTTSKDPAFMDQLTGGVSRKRVIKMLREYKQLENIETNEVTGLFLNSIKQMTQLQHLTITLSEKHMIEHCTAFRGLKSLSWLSLIIQKSKDLQAYDKEGFSLSFFQCILDNPKLKGLKLELQYSTIFANSKPIEDLLDYIGDSHIKNFNIQARLKEPNALNPAKTAKFLSQVDLLALQFLHESSKDHYKTHHNRHDGFGLGKWLQEGRIYEEVNQAMNQSSRALRIQYTRRPQMDISLILAQCIQIESLYIQWKAYQPIVLNRLPFNKTLKNFYVGFQQLRDEEIGALLSNLNYILKHMESVEGVKVLLGSKYFGQQSLVQLNEMYQQVSRKGIKNHSMEVFDECHMGKHLKVESLQTLFEEMKYMRSLESLKVHFNGGNTAFLRNLHNTLTSFKGLRTLDLLVFSQYHSEISFFFPVEELLELTELRLRFIGPLIKRCAEHLARNLVKLREIEVLEISEGCLCNISLDTFVIMMEDLRRLSKLRELSIQVPTVVDDEEEYVVQNRYLKGENYENFTNQISRDVKGLYKSNGNLRSACLYFQQNFYLDIVSERQLR